MLPKDLINHIVGVGTDCGPSSTTSPTTTEFTEQHRVSIPHDNHLDAVIGNGRHRSMRGLSPGQYRAVARVVGHQLIGSFRRPASGCAEASATVQSASSQLLSTHSLIASEVSRLAWQACRDNGGGEQEERTDSEDDLDSKTDRI